LIEHPDSAAHDGENYRPPYLGGDAIDADAEPAKESEILARGVLVIWAIEAKAGIGQFFAHHLPQLVQLLLRKPSAH